jgi:thioredoxin-related protein
VKFLHLVIATCLLALGWTAQAETARGRVSGGEVYALPEWFKLSFLDFQQDLDEARKQGKHLLVFLHLDECPYCARMLKENFRSGDNQAYLQKHFDVVALNIRGDRELVWVDGATHTEKELARALKVVATPTIVFLDLDGRKVLQLNGYRDPRAFRDVLEYIHGQHYRTQGLNDYVRGRHKPAVYRLRPHPRFTDASDFRAFRQPLAILFEDRDCDQCAEFHDRVLSRPDVQAEMAKFLFVRLDARSDKPLTGLDGRSTTPRRWAETLGLSYRPALVLFDEGREVARADGRLFPFHFRELLRFVSGGHYKRYESFSAYLAERQDELLKQGVNIDLSH